VGEAILRHRHRGAIPFAEEGDASNAYASSGRKRTDAEREAYAAIYRKAPIRDNL